MWVRGRSAWTVQRGEDGWNMTASQDKQQDSRGRIAGTGHLGQVSLNMRTDRSDWEGLPRQDKENRKIRT
jgi:hypothetical protein